MSDRTKIMREHPLATRDGLGLFVDLLFHIGAVCPNSCVETRTRSLTGTTAGTHGAMSLCQQSRR